MKIIQQIFAEHASTYIENNRHRMTDNQCKALDAIVRCRTPEAGTHIFECPACHEIHIANSSCGNRHCPVCQNDKATAWVHRQQMKGLPCTYFLVTFTVPPQLHGIALRYPYKVYRALFNASSAALKELIADERFVGCELAGFFGVLHTWGRQMQFHPHIHYVIPGGGLSKDRRSWTAARGDFLVHVRALSKLFRGKFRSELAKCSLSADVPYHAWKKEWVVHCKSVGDGRTALKYLGAYVFRVAISNARILSYDGQHVTFKYYKVGSRRPRKCTLDVAEFIRRFLQHILPTGFMKVRHYGFLHAKCAVTIAKIRELIARAGEIIREFVPPEPIEKLKPLLCVKCGGVMKWKKFISPWGMIYRSP